MKRKILNISWKKRKDNDSETTQFKWKKGESNCSYFITNQNIEWREPPKLLPPPPEKYYVEFPPDESCSNEGQHILEHEEEKELALNLGAGMNLKKKGNIEESCQDSNSSSKKTKVHDVCEKTPLEGNFGKFHMGHNNKSKAEEAGHPMSPTSK